MSDRDKFYELLAHFSFLEPFWDKGTHRVSLDGLDSSYFSNEQIIVKNVILSIWNGRSNEVKVDVTDIAALSPQDKKPLIEWLWNPFWP